MPSLLYCEDSILIGATLNVRKYLKLIQDGASTMYVYHIFGGYTNDAI